MDRKTFDINAPSQVNPSATSRPIIVGHRPTISDPMMRPPMPMSGQANQPQPAQPAPLSHHSAKIIEVTDEARNNIAVAATQPVARPTHLPEPMHASTPHLSAAPQPAPQSPAPAFAAQTVPQNPPQSNLPLAAQIPQDFSASHAPASPASAVQADASNTQVAPMTQQDLSHLPHMPVAHHHRRGGKLKSFILWLLVAGVLLAVAAFLLVDAGLVDSKVKLPFHIFNQGAIKDSISPIPANTSAVAEANKSSILKEYTDSDTHLFFTYPSTWTVDKYYDTSGSTPFYLTYVQSTPVDITSQYDSGPKEMQSPFFIAIISQPNGKVNPALSANMQKCDAAPFSIAADQKARSLVYADNSKGLNVRSLFLADDQKCVKNPKTGTFSVSDSFSFANSTNAHVVRLGYYEPGTENTSTSPRGAKLGLQQARILTVTGGGGAILNDKATFESTSQYKEAMQILTTLKPL